MDHNAACADQMAHTEPDAAQFEAAIILLKGFGHMGDDEARWLVRRTAALRSLGHPLERCGTIALREAVGRPWENNGLRW